MKELLKKEFVLCVHPTELIFLLFSGCVFIPNYPYEVMFFFSGLSIFFMCLTARENGDLAFSCTLLVQKNKVPVARILTSVVFQCVLIALTSVTVTIKQCCFTVENQINMAGNTANTAFIGYGLALLGIFNLIFFPMHFKRPEKVGVPFVIASVVVFVSISVMIVLRWTAPIFTDVLNTPDPQYIGAKIGVLIGGLVLYAGMTWLSCFLSARNFVKVDF